MSEFAILTNRKRAFIALVHSVVFLLLATWQMLGGAPASGMLAVSRISGGTWVLLAIYAIVSAVLFWLFAISGAWMERVYFALCTVSAASGLLRTVLGDQAFHSGRYIRVVMLGTAVVVGLMIMRLHSQLVENESEA